MGKFGNGFDKPAVQRATAWIGLLGFLIGTKCDRVYLFRDCLTITGITSFLVIRMWFGKAVEDFNGDVSRAGSGAPQLMAATSNGFISEFDTS